METAVATIPNASSYKKRETMPENNHLSRAEKRRIENEHAIALMEEGIRSGRIKYKDVLKALGDKRSKSPVFVVDREDFEDAMLGQMIEDGLNGEFVSEEEIMAILDE